MYLSSINFTCFLISPVSKTILISMIIYMWKTIQYSFYNNVILNFYVWEGFICMWIYNIIDLENFLDYSQDLSQIITTVLKIKLYFYLPNNYSFIFSFYFSNCIGLKLQNYIFNISNRVLALNCMGLSLFHHLIHSSYWTGLINFTHV